VKQHLVLYDGNCPLCRFQMRLLTWLDWFGRLALVPLDDPRAAATGISREALDEQMHCVTTKGRIYRGARCIRFVGLRLPLLIPLALFLWIPGVIWIAERVYAWISSAASSVVRVRAPSCRLASASKIKSCNA
jgi:predicted DCC family thiol-disulfide oxidoreductase YuxK